MSIGVLEENTYDRIEANTDCVVAPNSSPVIPPVTAELLAEMSRSICDLAYSESLVLALKYHLENWSDPLRAHQKETFRLLINFLEQGKLHGLIKHPTGAGKTRLFAELLLAMAVPSMILVPRTALLEQTKDTLIDVGFLESDIYVFGQKSWISIEDEVAELRDQKVRPTIYLITYQGLLSLYRNSLELLEYLIKPIKIVVSDEGHRGLGDKTNTLVQDIISPDQSSSTDSDETDQTEETITTEDEIVIDKLLQEQKKLHLSFTATPKLGEKEIQDIYKMEVIDWLRIQTLVEDGTLIFPQRICAGTVRATEDNESRLFSDGYLARLAATERFRTEDGRSVAHACTDTYLLKKQEVGGYLPGVVFCSSIKQAEEYVHYARSRGIRAVRSTSANKSYDSGVSPKDARTMLEADEVDLVVTVSKVGEGWDVPTMRCAIWLKPVYSSANYIQGIGRIIRALIAGSPFPAKSTENTFVIEPDWEVCYRKKDVKSRTPEEEDEEESYKDGRSIDIEDDKESKYHTKKSLNLFEHLIAMDEVHSTFIQDYLSSATEINQRYWTLDQWRKALEELGYNPQQWASMDYEEKVTFEVYGLGLYRLANKFCIAGSPVGNNLFHIQLGLVFWPEAKELKDYISNKEQNDKSLDELGTDPTKWRKVLEDMGYNSQRWAWMTSKEKKVIKIYDLGLQALASIFRVNGNPTANHDFHIQLGNIFWPEAKDFILSRLGVDPIKWKIELEDMGYNPTKWAGMLQKDKRKFTIHNLGLVALAGKFGIGGSPIGSHYFHIQLGQIFWPDNKGLSDYICNQQNSNKYLNEFGVDPIKWRKALEDMGYNPQKWKMMKPKEKSSFRLYNLGIKGLISKFGITGNPASLFNHIQLGGIFWPEAKELKDYISNKEQNNKSLDELGTDPSKWREELEDMGYNPRKWAEMTQQDKQSFKKNDLGLLALAGLFGIKKVRVVNNYVHLQLGSIFWPEAKELKDYISNIEQNDKALDDLSADPAKWRKMFEDMGHNPQSWRKMAYEDKQAIRIHGIGLYAISTKFGLEGDPIRKLSTYIQLGLIFWPESEELQETHKKFQQKSVLRED